VLFNRSQFLAAIPVLTGGQFSWVRFAHDNQGAVCNLMLSFFAGIALVPYPVPAEAPGASFGCVLQDPVVSDGEGPSRSLRWHSVRVSYILSPLRDFIRLFPGHRRVVSSVSGTHMWSGVTGPRICSGR